MKIKNSAFYLLNLNEIYKIQKFKILSILFTVFILLYSQRDMYYFKYYTQIFYILFDINISYQLLNKSIFFTCSLCIF